MAERAPFVELAAVVRAHGLRGEVIVKLFNAQSELLFEVDELLMRLPDGKPEPVLIQRARRHPKGGLVSFDGIFSREGAEAIRGAVLGLPREQLPELDEDEFYYTDLLGLQALDEDGKRIGEVADVIDYPSAVCLKVVGDEAQWEIPALDRYLGEVDPDGGVLVITAMDELDVFKSDLPDDD